MSRKDDERSGHIRGQRRPGRLKIVAGLLLVVFNVTACVSGDTISEKSESIAIGYTAWPEDIAITYLWQAILERRDYDVTITRRSVATLFAKMAAGDMDIFMDTWLPRTHKQYWKRYKKHLGARARWYNKATLELAVPRSMNVDSIDDLTKYADELHGKIIGIELSAGETRVLKRKVIPAYDLDRFRYVSSSTEGMLAALEGAIKNDAPIVVALWHPHLAYYEFPIKDLADPKGAWGEPEGIWVTTRQGFRQDRPEIWTWLNDFHLTPGQLDSLLVQVVRDARSPQDRREAANDWIRAHQKLVNEWTQQQ